MLTDLKKICIKKHLLFIRNLIKTLKFELKKQLPKEEQSHPKKTIITEARTHFFINAGAYKYLNNLYSMPSDKAWSFLLSLTQQKTSQRLFSCLAMSNAIRATKQVICIKKSIKSAIPAYKAKALTAGISDRAPRKVENRSVRARLWPWEPIKRPKYGIFRVLAWFLGPVFARKLCVTLKLTFLFYRVDHMFGNAVFCWLWVSWLTEGIFFRFKWKIYSKASKWHQPCLDTMSNIGVMWHTSQQKNTQFAVDHILWKLAWCENFDR